MLHGMPTIPPKCVRYIFAKLFEMFSQQQDAQGRSEGGLGIGLALTRGLVHLHASRAEAGNGKMVLVVDDNVDAAQTLAALLELDGWNTTIAHDAVEAAARTLRQRPCSVAGLHRHFTKAVESDELPRWLGEA